MSYTISKGNSKLTYQYIDYTMTIRIDSIGFNYILNSNRQLRVEIQIDSFIAS